TDLIPMIISKTLKLNPHIRFKWIAFDESRQDGALIKEDLRKLGVLDYVQLIPFSSDPLIHFANLDVFVLTSREESFSIVSLENIALGVPVICFNQNIGAIELIKDGAGSTVEYLNLDEVASEIESYASGRLKLKHASKKGIITAQLYSSDAVLKKFDTIILNSLNDRN
ncbi:MAG TPA: glycosyltransferase, partial [Cytophagales bacterium]|nr:glycosyltransferase [Cytophagales bacterium]